MKMTTEPDHEADVAHARGHERLHRGSARGLLLVPEADQQVGAQPHDLPRHEEEQEVVGEHEEEHRRGEEREHRVVPAHTLVLVHVADRVDLDARANDRHDDEHDRCHRVERDTEVKRDSADLGDRVCGVIGVLDRVPGCLSTVSAFLGKSSTGPDTREGDEREDRGRDDRRDRDPTHAVAHRPRQRRQDRERDHRQKRYGENVVHYLPLQPIHRGQFDRARLAVDREHERETKTDLSGRDDHREDREELTGHRGRA